MFYENTFPYKSSIAELRKHKKQGILLWLILTIVIINEIHTVNFLMLMSPHIHI